LAELNLALYKKRQNCREEIFAIKGNFIFGWKNIWQIFSESAKISSRQNFFP